MNDITTSNLILSPLTVIPRPLPPGFMVSLGVSRPPKDNMSPSTGVLGIPATLLIEPPGADVAVHGSPTRAAAGGIAPSVVVSALSMSLRAAVPGPM